MLRAWKVSAAGPSLGRALTWTGVGLQDLCGLEPSLRDSQDGEIVRARRRLHVPPLEHLRVVEDPYSIFVDVIATKARYHHFDPMQTGLLSTVQMVPTCEIYYCLGGLMMLTHFLDALLRFVGYLSCVAAALFIQDNAGQMETTQKILCMTAMELPTEGMAGMLFVPLGKLELFCFTNGLHVKGGGWLKGFFATVTCLSRLGPVSGDYMDEVKQHFLAQYLLSSVYDLIGNTGLECKTYKEVYSLQHSFLWMQDIGQPFGAFVSQDANVLVEVLEEECMSFLQIMDVSSGPWQATSQPRGDRRKR